MPLIVKNGIGGGICHAVNQYANTDKKYMKDYDKNNRTI